MLGYVAWEYYGSNVVARHHQAELIGQLHREWEGGRAPDTAGSPFAVVTIPRFGADYAVPLIKGVTEDDLARGIGWFTDTSRPGRIGNFVVGAHRVTHGEPFRDLPDLQAGDQVIVTTRTHVYTYVLDEGGADREVDFAQTWILDPVPGSPSAEPTRALITLVTCAELFHTDERNVVLGHLLSTEQRTP
jgi:sortase A